MRDAVTQWILLRSLAVLTLASACYNSDHDSSPAPGDDGTGTAGAGGMVVGTGPAGGMAGAAPARGAAGTAPAGGTAGSGQENTLAVLQACQAACGNWAQCGYQHSCPTCTALNVVYTARHNEACIEAALAEYECEAVQTCPSLDLFNDSPLEHPYCGTTAAHFQATCGYSAQPPEACIAYCARAAECNPMVGQGECTYSCNLEVGALLSDDPPECHQDLLNRYACLATLDCTALQDWLTDQASPAACNSVMSGTCP